MPVSDKVREDRVRRRLWKDGLVLKKTPARSWQRGAYGVGYMVVDDRTNTLVMGCGGREYDATLDEVETYAFEGFSTR